MMRMRPLLLSLLALVLACATMTVPAEAAAARPIVALRAFPQVVSIPSTATLTGTVSGRSRGATVTLQRRSGSVWKSVKSSTVRRNKTYRFSTTIRTVSTVFRVKVRTSSRLRSATSRSVRVTGAAAADAVQNLILRKTNEFRAQHGRSPLTLLPALNSIAEGWSEQMATTGDFEHNPRFSASYPAGWTAAGENIAAGQAPEDVVTAWINSPAHRENLLGDYTYIGIGHATGGPYRRYYTQNFARYPGR